MPDPSPLSTLLLAVMLKGTVVLALAWAAARVFGGASAAARHGVWVAAFAALLVLPALESVGPAWLVPVLPTREQPPQASPTASVPASGPALSFSLEAGASSAAATASRLDSEARLLAPLQPAQPHASARVASAPVVSGAASREVAAEAAAASSPPGGRALFERTALFGWAMGLWALGAAVVGAGWMGAFVAAWRLVGRARVEEDPAWTALASQAGRRMGLSPSVRLLRSSRLDVPIAWGFGAGAVVLPAAADRWTADRRAAVVLHEMAHLRRRDAWTQMHRPGRARAALVQSARLGGLPALSRHPRAGLRRRRARGRDSRIGLRGPSRGGGAGGAAGAARAAGALEPDHE